VSVCVFGHCCVAGAEPRRDRIAGHLSQVFNYLLEGKKYKCVYICVFMCIGVCVCVFGHCRVRQNRRAPLPGTVIKYVRVHVYIFYIYLCLYVYI